MVAAGEAVAAVARAGVVPSALELLDRHCLRAVNEWKNLGLEADAAAILLARVDAPGAAGEAEADAILACFEATGATWAARSDGRGRGRRAVRRAPAGLPGLERLGPVLTEDVCVPVAKVPAMLARIEAIAVRARRADRQHRARR